VTKSRKKVICKEFCSCFLRYLSKGVLVEHNNLRPNQGFSSQIFESTSSSTMTAYCPSSNLYLSHRWSREGFHGELGY
jgi:hypothetical protein